MHWLIFWSWLIIILDFPFLMTLLLAYQCSNQEPILIRLGWAAQVIHNKYFCKQYPPQYALFEHFSSEKPK